MEEKEFEYEEYQETPELQEYDFNNDNGSLSDDDLYFLFNTKVK